MEATTSVAQRLVLWALDEEVADSILGGSYLGNEFCNLVPVYPFRDSSPE